jgi:hypothetical protein
MKFDEKPNYELLKSFFNRLLSMQGNIQDRVFDWVKKVDSKQAQQQ